jgi:hypothetical protein
LTDGRGGGGGGGVRKLPATTVAGLSARSRPAVVPGAPGLLLGESEGRILSQ